MRKEIKPVDSLKYKQPRGGISENQESTETIIIRSGLNRPILIIHDLKHKFYWTVDLIDISNIIDLIDISELVKGIEL